MNSLLEN